MWSIKRFISFSIMIAILISPINLWAANLDKVDYEVIYLDEDGESIAGGQYDYEGTGRPGEVIRARKKDIPGYEFVRFDPSQEIELKGKGEVSSVNINFIDQSGEIVSSEIVDAMVGKNSEVFPSDGKIVDLFNKGYYIESRIPQYLDIVKGENKLDIKLVKEAEDDDLASYSIRHVYIQDGKVKDIIDRQVGELPRAEANLNYPEGYYEDYLRDMRIESSPISDFEKFEYIARDKEAREPWIRVGKDKYNSLMFLYEKNKPGIEDNRPVSYSNLRINYKDKTNNQKIVESKEYNRLVFGTDLYYLAKSIGENNLLLDKEPVKISANSESVEYDLNFSSPSFNQIRYNYVVSYLYINEYGELESLKDKDLKEGFMGGNTSFVTDEENEKGKFILKEGEDSKDFKLAQNQINDFYHEYEKEALEKFTPTEIIDASNLNDYKSSKSEAELNGNEEPSHKEKIEVIYRKVLPKVSFDYGLLENNLIIEKEFNRSEIDNPMNFEKVKRAGYEFIGWTSEDIDGKRILYKEGDRLAIIDGKIYLAKWEKIDSESGEKEKPETEGPGLENGFIWDGQLIEDKIEDKKEKEVDREFHELYMRGYPDKSIRPEENLTREELSQLLYNLYKLDYSPGLGFKDMDQEDWAWEAVTSLNNMGIVIGYPDGLFRPKNPISRAEFVTVLVRQYKLKNPVDYIFKDTSNHWAEDYIKLGVGEGFIEGYPDKTFRPNKPITRAEAIKIINKLEDRSPLSILEDLNKFYDLDEKKWYYKEMMEAAVDHYYDAENPKHIWLKND